MLALAPGMPPPKSRRALAGRVLISKFAGISYLEDPNATTYLLFWRKRKAPLPGKRGGVTCR